MEARSPRELFTEQRRILENPRMYLLAVSCRKHPPQLPKPLKSPQQVARARRKRSEVLKAAFKRLGAGLQTEDVQLAAKVGSREAGST